MDVLTNRGRTARVAATLLGAALLLAGTLVGADDHFPFGPFRMYATTDSWDAPVADTRVEAIDATGNRVVITERNSGVRRAEIEGQLDLFRADPSRLRSVVDAYAAHNPQAPALVEISVVVRNHELSRRGPTGRWHDDVAVSWRVGS